MNDLSSMMGEILKMQDFHHPHVMTLIGVSFDANHTPSIVMPFMANGSVLSFLRNKRSSLIISEAVDDEIVRLSLCTCTTNFHVIGIYTAPHIPEALNEDML